MESEKVILALAALAQTTRLEAFRLLKHEPDGLPAGEIAGELAVPQNTILFLCTSNRSILAEAALNKEGRGRFHVYSAGNGRMDGATSRLDQAS